MKSVQLNTKSNNHFCCGDVERQQQQERAEYPEKFKILGGQPAAKQKEPKGRRAPKGLRYCCGVNKLRMKQTKKCCKDNMIRMKTICDEKPIPSTEWSDMPGEDT